MLKELQATYTHKFADPFTAYLYDVSMNGFDDDRMGDACDGPGHLALLGRHVLITSPSGFVDRAKLDRKGQTLHEYAEENWPSIADWEDQPEDEGW